MSANGAASAVAEALCDARAEDVCVFDVSARCGWADFAVVATVPGLLHGAHRLVCEQATRFGLREVHRKKRGLCEEQWRVLDFGSILVHLMSAQARAFYDLDWLWQDCLVAR